MRFVLIVIALALVAPERAVAQLPRDVLLDVCNDAPFAAAVAAAYPTRPDGPRTLRTWFVVQPGACLEGAVTGVVGSDVDLHVMSGEWRWPQTAGDLEYCVPASGGTLIAAQPNPDCAVGHEARAFRRTAVEVTSRRGNGGNRLGRATYRIDCAGQGDDATLCDRSPTDFNGFAQPLRALEFCNSWSRPKQVYVAEATGEANVQLVAYVTIPSDTCQVIYRGYPHANSLIVAEAGRTFINQDGALCVAPNADGASLATGSDCDVGDASGFQFIRFRDGVGRFTMYPGQD